MHKLCDRRGETLTETLCAVLVLALAVALLAAMISASSRLDRKTEQTAAELYKSCESAENPTTAADAGTVNVQIGSGTDKSVEVEFYGNPEQAVSYRKKEGNSAS